MFRAVYIALVRPAVARLVFPEEIFVGLVVKPASAYAVTTVVTSLTWTKLTLFGGDTTPPAAIYAEHSTARTNPRTLDARATIE